jgi:hypothetical protein
MSVALKKNMSECTPRKLQAKHAAQPKEPMVETKDIKIDGMKILLEARGQFLGIKAAMAKLRSEDRYGEISYGSPVGNERW